VHVNFLGEYDITQQIKFAKWSSNVLQLMAFTFFSCSLAHLVDYISLPELGSTSTWVSVLLVLDKQILHTYLFLKLHEN
jgi:Golgi nucleoside diphosphatase